MKNTEEQKILLIEDNPGDSRLIKEMLKEITSFNFQLIIAETLKEGCEEIKKNDFILILLDLNLPDSSGIKTFDTVINFAEKIPVVLLSGMQNVELSLTLIKEGAQDYITKQDLNSTLLGRTIQFAIERKKLLSELDIANKELAFQNEEKGKRAAELTRSKQLLDETGRLARVGGWEFDLKNNKLSWSDIVYEIHEVEPDYQPTTESAINFYAPEAIPIISEAVRLAIEEGKSFDVDLQLITAKQNSIWVRAIGQAYRVNGEIVKIGGVFQDITDRKQAEKTLDQERVLLRTIIDNFPNSIFVKDKKYRKIVVNLEHTRRVTTHLSPAIPFSTDDLLGKTDFEVYPRELAEEFLIEDQKVIEGGQYVLNQELLSIDTNGLTHWELISKIPLRDRNGEIIGLVGISNDITERKRTEQALLQSEENFRRSISESPLGIRIISFEGETIYVNKAFLDIYKYNSLEEFRSIQVINRYTPESYAQHQIRK